MIRTHLAHRRSFPPVQHNRMPQRVAAGARRHCHIISAVLQHLNGRIDPDSLPRLGLHGVGWWNGRQGRTRCWKSIARYSGCSTRRAPTLLSADGHPCHGGLRGTCRALGDLRAPRGAFVNPSGCRRRAAHRLNDTLGSQACSASRSRWPGSRSSFSWDRNRSRRSASMRPPASRACATTVISSRLLSLYLRQPYAWFLSRNSADASRRLLSEVNNFISKSMLPSLELAASGLQASAIIFFLLLSIL